MATQQEVCHKVFITKTTSVRPRHDHDHNHQLPQSQQCSKLLRLSNLDRKCPVLMYLVFFYKSPPPPHHTLLSEAAAADESLFLSLKMGLEETLSDWYPAAGRLSLNPTNGKLDLMCNDAGALFIEAITQMSISKLGDLSQYNSFFENLVFRPPFSGNFSDMPLVVAQVTKFGCGGYTVGLGTSHSLFDGSATYNFVRAWASNVSGGLKVDHDNVELISEPVHERGMLLVGPDHQTNYSSLAQLVVQEKKTTRVLAFEHLHQLIHQATQSAEVDQRNLGGFKFSEMGSIRQEDFVLVTLPVTHEMIQRLRSKVASSGKNGSTPCSSFEVVAAHLWQARTNAFGFDKERMVSLQFSVDARNKMSPPLPRGFSGNAYVLSSISSTTAELAEHSLADIVKKINEAKNAVTDGYVKAYVEALKVSQTTTLPPLPELTIISDWTRTPYHKVDFGYGRAAYVYPMTPPIPQLAYFMQNPNETGGIHVRIGIQAPLVEAFSQNFFDV